MPTAVRQGFSGSAKKADRQVLRASSPTREGHMESCGYAPNLYSLTVMTHLSLF
jgi:hypothetical protein